MKVALLNSYFPPDAAITGSSLAEIIPFLRDCDPQIEIRIFASAASYRGSETHHPEIGDEVTRLGPSRRLGGRIGRLAQSLLLGRRMAREAVKWADVILSLTDPPLLGFWIGRELANARRPIRWIEWTMDLYPEAFVAARLVGKNNPVYRFIQASQRNHAPDAWICLGEGQAKAITQMRGVCRPTVIMPCGICDTTEVADEIPDWRRREARLVLAYAGNLGEAHCPDLLPALVEAADPKKFAFRISAHGAHALGLRRRIDGRKNITWCEQISHSDLAFADAHVASLRSNWTHVCVPSKAVTTIGLGRPLIFAGDLASDTATMFSQAAWVLSVPEGGRYDHRVIDEILRKVADSEERDRKRDASLRLSKRLREEKAISIADVTRLVLNG